MTTFRIISNCVSIGDVNTSISGDDSGIIFNDFPISMFFLKHSDHEKETYHLKNFSMT